MAYDELYDGIFVRPLYRDSFRRASKRTPSQQKRAVKRAEATISHDASFLPNVRLISSREYDIIVKGVRQRGRALQMFLTDYYFGDRSYEQAGLLNASQVETIVSRYRTAKKFAPLRPENIQFWYAPDVIRDEAGAFRVIEDNIGFVGGLGDLEAMAAAARALGVSIPASRHPREFYRNLVAEYRRQARLCGGGKLILVSPPRSHRFNYEDHRLEEILERLNVTRVTDLRRLKVRPDGLFLQGSRVGFVILNIKVEDIDPGPSTPYRVGDFWLAVSKGQVGVSYAPGLEFAGDKALCASVERLIKLYLNEKCLLPSLITVKLATQRSRRLVETNRKNWVVKLARGQSGESVWLGPHISEAAWAKLFKRIARRPSDFIAQKYSEPSQFLGHPVDLRPIAVITDQSETVSPLPWGRAAARKKSKTNISCGGLLAPVAIVPG